MPDSNAVSSIAVVTGASSGIGLACARRLGRHHSLILADINPQGLERATGELTALGYQAVAHQVDITEPDSVERLAAAARSAGDLRALVHAAGLSPTMADGRRIIEVNLVGTALIERAFLPLAGPGTAAVLIASTAGHMQSVSTRRDGALTSPLSPDLWIELDQDFREPGHAYSLSKRAVILYCEAVAPEWGARGARITSVSPGLIATPMGEREFAAYPAMQAMVSFAPVARWGQADDIAEAVAFLTSDRASFITGTDIRVDGGVTAVLNRAIGRPTDRPPSGPQR